MRSEDTAGAELLLRWPAGASPRHDGAGSGAAWTCLWSAGVLANAPALRRALGTAPAAPVAELLATAFARWDDAAAEHLEGDLTAVLWDGAGRRLVAVSDRRGHHPLYAAGAAGLDRLASSAEALLADLPSRPPLEERSVLAHLCGLPPRLGETFHRGVSCLAPGTVTGWTSGRREQRVYWRLEPGAADRRGGEELAEALWDLLSRVAPEYAGSGRVGLLLSGGLDSPSLLAALRAARADLDLVGLCWSAPELPAADEYPQAVEIGRRFGVETVEVRGDLAWPLRDADGEWSSPASPSRPFYQELWHDLLARGVETGVERVVTGIGGDELFGAGIWPYADLLLAGRLGSLVAQLRRHRRLAELAWAPLLRATLARPLLGALSPSWRERLPRPPPWLRPEHRSRLGEAVGGRPEWPLRPGRSARFELLATPWSRQPIEALGRAARARGLTVAHPWLDRRLVELAAALPATETAESGYQKAVLRRALRGRLPAGVLQRHRKVVPLALLDRGLREREVARVRPLLYGMRAAERGWVDEERFRDHVEGYLAGGRSQGLFWHTLTLERWLRDHPPP